MVQGSATTMIQLEFRFEDKEALAQERFEHPHPQVQRKLEALWLKSLDLPHGCKRRSKSAAGVRCLTGRGLARGGTFKHGEECMPLWNNGPRSADECWWKE
jgi:hypothetical protein